MKIRKHYIFKGRVQAVGFRYTAYKEARKLGLTGFVKNLNNNNVEAEFQGEAHLIDEVIKKLKYDRFIYIASMKVDDIDVIDNETSFEVLY